jgi:hypothetical protein
MRKNEIFCSTDFWKKFSMDRAIVSRNQFDDDGESLECWWKYYRMIKRSSINFEFDEKYIVDSNDETLQRIWQEVANGDKPKETFVCSSKPNITYDNIQTDASLLRALYLTHETPISKYGIISASESEYLSKYEFFKDSGEAIEKGTHDSWNRLLSNSKHQFNAMVVMDNYIFHDRPDFNLSEILETLLPKEIDVPFHLTIVASTERVAYDELAKDKKHERISIEEYTEKRREKIISLIHNIRPSLAKNLEVETFRMDKRYVHDRTILTNYMLLYAGGGFNLFGKDKETGENKAGKSTKLCAVYPRFIEHGGWEELYNIFIKDILDGLKSIGKSSKNRLLIKDY